MLMALLPLAGWAATDMSEVNFSVGNVTYGGTAAPVFLVTYDVTLNTTDHYTWDGKYYSDADCEIEAADENGSAYTISTLPVNTYYVKIEGKNMFEGTKIQSFQVNKAPLSIKINGGTALHTVYGTPYTVTTPITYEAADANQLKNSESFTDVVTGTITAVIYEGTAATKTATGGDLTPSVSPYTVTFEGLTSANYELSGTGGMDIWQKELNATDFTYALVASSSQYTASVPTIEYNVSFGETALVAGTDYDVAVYSDAARTADVTSTFKTVATYYTKIVGKGNFAGSYFSAADADKANYIYDITKAGLRIAALNQTKKYDGNGNLPSTAEGTAYTVTGIQGGDVPSKIFATSSPSLAISGSNYTVGEKTIVISATPYSGSETVADNYDFNLVNAKLTIEKLPITITPNTFTKKFNETDETATGGFNSSWPTSPTIGTSSNVKGYKGVTVVETGETTTPSIVSSELTNLFGQYKTSSPNKTYAGIYVAKKSGTSDNKGEYDDALEVKVTNSSAPVLANYDITYATGKYIIAGGKIYVTAEAKTKVYGEDDPELTYTVDGLSGTDVLATVPTLTREEGEDVKAGGYTINLAGAVAPDGYEDIVYGTAKLTITKRDLTLTAADQTLANGKKATDLQQTGYYSVSGLATRDAAFTDFKATFTTTAVTDGEGNTIAAVPSLDADSKLNETAGTTVTGGIQCVAGADAGTFKAANYNITYVYGNLTVVSATAIVLDDTKDVKATLAAATGTNDVTFTTRALTANSWNVLVLPFDITVSDLSKALGYAVVDAMDQTASDGNVHFDIYMGTIKANTPFMFKVDGEKTNLSAVTFAGKTIVYDPTNADEDAVQIDADGNSYITDGAGNKLVGLYSSKAVAAGEYYLGTVDGKVTWKPAASAFNWKGERAKLVLANASSAPQIFVQEPDGSVTAISTITAEGVAVEADGWYTINGIKLEGAPTEKGIYIRNGKKLVIK